jgi:hypothetical protein
MFDNLFSFKAGWVDIALTKIAVFAAALLIAKLWTPILSLEWYWYFAVWIIAAIKPLNAFFKFSK